MREQYRKCVGCSTHFVCICVVGALHRRHKTTICVRVHNRRTSVFNVGINAVAIYRFIALVAKHAGIACRARTATTRPHRARFKCFNTFLARSCIKCFRQFVDFCIQDCFTGGICLAKYIFAQVFVRQICFCWFFAIVKCHKAILIRTDCVGARCAEKFTNIRRHLTTGFVGIIYGININARIYNRLRRIYNSPINIFDTTVWVFRTCVRKAIINNFITSIDRIRRRQCRTVVYP